MLENNLWYRQLTVYIALLAFFLAYFSVFETKVEFPLLFGLLFLPVFAASFFLEKEGKTNLIVLLVADSAFLVVDTMFYSNGIGVLVNGYIEKWNEFHNISGSVMTKATSGGTVLPALLGIGFFITYFDKDHAGKTLSVDYRCDCVDSGNPCCNNR